MGEYKDLSNLGDWYIDTDSITSISVSLSGIATNFNGTFDKQSISYQSTSKHLLDKSQ